MSIVIRPVKTIAESRMVEDLSMRVWGAGPESVVPDHVIITIAKNGGVVLLALDGEQPVGFCLGFVGFTKELRIKHCSHQVGVLSAYQNSGLGYQLKVMQRQMVLGQGIDHVTWTFDPLGSRNANLNLHKLGAVCRTYLPDLYGQIRDSLNKGLPTDRFQVDWWVKSEWVGSRVDSTPSLPTLSEWEARGVPMAKTALENAVWDLLAKAEGKPLCEVFGGVRERVEVGVSIGIQPTLEGLLARVDDFVAQGYRRIKVKIKPGWELKPLTAIRERHPDIPLMADANSAFSLEDAPLFKQMDKLNLLMIEQPLGYDDIADHAKLQAQIETPLCLDESIHSPDHARWALELNACRIINMKVARVGGLSNALAIHDMCQQAGVALWCGEVDVSRSPHTCL